MVPCSACLYLTEYFKEVIDTRGGYVYNPYNLNKEETRMNLNFLNVLGLVFIVLKLTECITWSWWLVLIPFYLPILVLVLLIMATVYHNDH